MRRLFAAVAVLARPTAQEARPQRVENVPHALGVIPRHQEIDGADRVVEAPAVATRIEQLPRLDASRDIPDSFPLVEVVPLTAEYPALVEAAAMLARPVES